MPLSEIDSKMQHTEVRKRKEYLISQLQKLDIYQLPDGRKVDESLTLYTLEWSHIDAKNEAAKAYGDHT